MITSAQAANLYLDHRLDESIQEALVEWSRVIAEEPPLPPVRWHMRIDSFLRHAAIGASTRIEGNPLSLGETDALLQGEPVDASPVDRQEVVNYGRALAFGTTLAQDPQFEWAELIVRSINAEVMRDLPDDTHGRYRNEPIAVGTFYAGPDAHTVAGLMAAWADWLRTSTDLHPLVRVALLHLNLVAIHPWVNGNGRTARILSSMELMRHTRAPELVSIDAALAQDQNEYFRRIREAVGPTYAPDRHSVSEWVGWYVRLHTERLEEGRRLNEAGTHDIGTIVSALQRRNEPLAWGPVIHVAALELPVRTSEVMEMTETSSVVSRTILRRMAVAGWLEPHGRTRGMFYTGTDLIRSLNLRGPELIHRYIRAETLGR